ncbi:hypothetical protein HPB52_012649 [Rhipicephalus sanguineus]|uniref:Reductase n=1 Tax=Rhipicephalus sanguineus TaxID=34632 RepID=A0A9D4PYL7_RHISA|nr:hypothetical protein HPB52_012649 [Rhipicephalus sanguineus]
MIRSVTDKVKETQRNIPYGVTKAALEHLTRCAALENAPYGGLATYSNDKHALGRIGTPEEVARSIAFLASDDATFVTGITMPVDGGLLLLSSISNAPKILDAQKAA